LHPFTPQTMPRAPRRKRGNATSGARVLNLQGYVSLANQAKYEERDAAKKADVPLDGRRLELLRAVREVDDPDLLTALEGQFREAVDAARANLHVHPSPTPGAKTTGQNKTPPML